MSFHKVDLSQRVISNWSNRILIHWIHRVQEHLFSRAHTKIMIRNYRSEDLCGFPYFWKVLVFFGAYKFSIHRWHKCRIFPLLPSSVVMNWMPKTVTCVFCMHWRLDAGFQGKTLRIYWHCVLSSTFFSLPTSLPKVMVCKRYDVLKKASFFWAEKKHIVYKFGVLCAVWMFVCDVDGKAHVLVYFSGFYCSKFPFLFCIKLTGAQISHTNERLMWKKLPCRRSRKPNFRPTLTHRAQQNNTPFRCSDSVEKGKTIYWMSFSNLRGKI